MSGMYVPKDGDIVYGVPPFLVSEDARTQSPQMKLSGVYKAEAGDPYMNYCAEGNLPDGQYVCVPERFLRAALPEAIMGGVVSVKQHPKVGGSPEQKIVNLDLARIKVVLDFIGTKAPADRPFGPRPEIG